MNENSFASRYIKSELSKVGDDDKARDIRAMELVFEKWDYVALFLEEHPEAYGFLHLGPSTCALCYLYYYGEKGCDSKCPVISIGGGRKFCWDTPYERLTRAMDSSDESKYPGGKIPEDKLNDVVLACVEERDFLRGILDKMRQDQ